MPKNIMSYLDAASANPARFFNEILAHSAQRVLLKKRDLSNSSINKTGERAGLMR